MFERLDLIEEKYNKLLTDLTSPEIVGNIKKVTEIINQNSYEATKISELKNKIKKEKSENV